MLLVPALCLIKPSSSSLHLCQLPRLLLLLLILLVRHGRYDVWHLLLLLLLVLLLQRPLLLVLVLVPVVVLLLLLACCSRVSLEPYSCCSSMWQDVKPGVVLLL